MKQMDPQQETREAFELLLAQANELIKDETDWIATLANISALLKEHYEGKVNWVGFYRLEGNDLILGPFQGKVACVRLPEGKGVCQKAVATRATVNIQDVHQFPGHIACDSASLSEIVIPIIVQGQIKGVLDLDSPQTKAFDELDEYYLTRIVRLIESIYPNK